MAGSGNPTGCGSAGAGARQHRHFPSSFRRYRRSIILQATFLSPRIYLDGHVTRLTQNFEPHHQQFGVTRLVAGRRPRGRVDWVEASAAARQNGAQVSQALSLGYKIHLRSGPENRTVSRKAWRGFALSSLYGTQSRSVFKSHSSNTHYPECGGHSLGAGSLQGVCVTTEHADRTLDPHPPLAGFRSPSLQDPND